MRYGGVACTSRAGLLIDINRLGLPAEYEMLDTDYAAIYRRPDFVDRDRRAHDRVAGSSGMAERDFYAGRLREYY